MKTLLSIDPGSDKCGFAVVRSDLTVVEKGIVYLAELHRLVKRVHGEHALEVILMGGGTTSASALRLINSLELATPVRLVGEKNTTRQARERYFREHPPTGIWRWVPLGLQTPPCPVDDYAAVIIAERYLYDQGGEKK